MSKTAVDTTKLANSLPQLGDDSAQSAIVSSDDGAGQRGSILVYPGGKEGEPTVSAEQSYIDEGKLVVQIETTSDELDKKALEVVEKELHDVQASQPQPKIPPDLEDAGVVNPQQEADKVIKEGTSLSLPIDETEYKQGLSGKADGRWLGQEKVVIGSNSFVALALWVKRMIGRAHQKAMKVVFRKGGNK